MIMVKGHIVSFIHVGYRLLCLVGACLVVLIQARVQSILVLLLQSAGCVPRSRAVWESPVSSQNRKSVSRARPALFLFFVAYCARYRRWRLITLSIKPWRFQHWAVTHSTQACQKWADESGPAFLPSPRALTAPVTCWHRHEELSRLDSNQVERKATEPGDKATRAQWS